MWILPTLPLLYWFASCFHTDVSVGTVPAKGHGKLYFLDELLDELRDELFNELTSYFYELFDEIFDELFDELCDELFLRVM